MATGESEIKGFTAEQAGLQKPEITTLGEGSAFSHLEDFVPAQIFAGMMLYAEGWFPNAQTTQENPEASAIVTADKDPQVLGYARMMMGMLSDLSWVDTAKTNEIKFDFLPVWAKDSDLLKTMAAEFENATVLEGHAGTTTLRRGKNKHVVNTFTPLTGKKIYFETDGTAFTRNMISSRKPFYPGARFLRGNNLPQDASKPDRLYIVTPQPTQK